MELGLIMDPSAMGAQGYSFHAARGWKVSSLEKAQRVVSLKREHRR